MKERPILFNTAMVQAILAGRKTQTRRVVKHQPPGDCFQLLRVVSTTGPKSQENKLHWARLSENKFSVIESDDHYFSSFSDIGDRLWVRESFRLFDASDECGCSESPCVCPRNGTPIYRSTHDDGESKWKPSLHMPRTACRIILEITGLRVERLQDISEEDALAEGVHTDDDYPTDSHCPKCKGSGLHGSVGQHGGFEEVDCLECNLPTKRFSHVWNSTGGDWKANPWVWVVEFKVLTTNGVIREVAV